MAVRVEFGAVDAGLDREAKKQARNIKNLTAAAKENRTEQAKLERDTIRGMRAAESATDRFRRKLELLRASREKGRLTEAEYRFGVRQTRMEMERLHGAGRQAFGPAAIRQVAAMAGPVALVHKGLRAVTQELEAQAELRKTAAQEARETEVERAGLAQLAQGDQQVFERLTAAAVRMETAAGVQENEAIALIAKLQSIGALDQAADVARLVGPRVTGTIDDTLSLLESYYGMQQSFTDVAGRSFRDFVSMNLAGAAPSPVMVQQLGAEGGRLGQLASNINVTGIEAIAMLEAITEAIGDPKEARTQLNAIFAAWAREGMTQGTALERIRATDEAGYTARERFTMFGRRGQAGVSTLITGQDKVAERIDAMQTGIDRGLATQTEMLLRADPSQAILRATREQTVMAEQQLRLRMAEPQLAVEAVRKTRAANMGWWGRALQNMYDPLTATGWLAPEWELQQQAKRPSTLSTALQTAGPFGALLEFVSRFGAAADPSRLDVNEEMQQQLIELTRQNVNANQATAQALGGQPQAVAAPGTE